LLEGFCLHADTHLHAKDRQGLERLCRHGARGALALERLSRMEDGRLAYRMKRPLPDGTTRLFFTGLTLLRRLASLVPPPRANLTFNNFLRPGSSHVCKALVIALFTVSSAVSLVRADSYAAVVFLSTPMLIAPMRPHQRGGRME
jgi:hypothetical protein